MPTALVRFATNLAILSVTASWMSDSRSDEKVRATAIVTHLISQTDAVRSEIEQRAIVNNTVEHSGQGIYLPLASKSYGPSRALITDHGVIAISNPQYDLMIVLEPVVRHGNVDWRCTAKIADAKNSADCKVAFDQHGERVMKK